MKRSEMLLKMFNCYKQCRVNLNYEPLKAMDQVLELLEEEGMLPPYSDEIAQLNNAYGEGHIMNCQWDREDLGPHKTLPAEDFDLLVDHLLEDEDDADKYCGAV